MNKSWYVIEFCERQLSRGVSKSELKKLLNSDSSERSHASEDQVLLEEYRCLQEKIARDRFEFFCDSLAVGFDRREPCNSPNFDGCTCQVWDSDSESEEREWAILSLPLQLLTYGF